MPISVCTKCGAEYAYDREAPVFCAKCASRLQLLTDLETEIREALSEADITLRHEKLMLLRNAYPGEKRIEFEILCIGRMHEKGGKPDFYRIPFWPLTAFEAPKQFSAKERDRMLKSYFENEEALRVCALYEDDEAFWRDYHYRMARGFVDLCLKGNNENSTFWGFKRKNADIMTRCAHQLKKMLSNMKTASYPSENQRELLAKALKEAFIAEFESENAGEYIENDL